MTSQIVEYEDRAEIVTTKGARFVIDLEDVAKVSGKSWCRLSARWAYACTRLEGRLMLLHRLLLDASAGMQIDHIDGNPANNRRSNLRLCTHAENRKNNRKHSNNTSGFKGVSWHKQAKRWHARIMINYKSKHLGYFDTPEQAKAAYDAAAERLFGEFKRAQEHE